MRVAIISDIHGNRHAFEAVLEAVRADGADATWCLGDLVGYGADPDACVALAREHADACLAGNHDLAVTGALPIDEFSPGAAAAVEWTQEAMEPANVTYLRGLRPSDQREGVGLYHASPRDPVWEYVLSPLLAELSLSEMRERVGLIGHSHVALAFTRPPDGPVSGERRYPDDEADLGGDAGWLLNPGSVGQPRDGDPRAAWLLLDLDRERATWQRTEYDIEGAAAAIRTAGLPDSLADRLQYGQ
jgi:predicted phosphodiesterase